MTRSRSRTPPPGFEINTRLSALHGFQIAQKKFKYCFGARSGPMDTNVQTCSSGLSVMSAEGSPQGDVNIQAPQKDSVESASTSLRSTITDRRNVAACPSKTPNDTFSQLMDAQSNNGTQGTVDEVVYAAARSLRAASSDEGFTLFGDVPRTTIVVKWMRFYHYYPNADKATDKLRRDELKANLKIPPGCGQRLGSFIINKFNCFRKWGYVYWDGKHNVEYFPRTDAWLSPTWDGNIERPVDKTLKSRGTRSPSSRIRTKQPGSPPAEREEKRQRVTDKSSATFSVEITTTIPKPTADVRSGSSALPSERPLPSKDRSLNDFFDEQLELGNQPESARRNETNNGRRTQEIDVTSDEFTNPVDDSTIRVSVTPRMTATVAEAATEKEILASPAGTTDDFKTGTEKVGKSTVRSRNLAPNPQELCARLEATITRSTSGMANDSSSSARLVSTANPVDNLGSLRHKEKSCLQNLKETIKELERTREEHQKLCRNYENLEAEARAMVKIVDKNSRRRKAAATPLPLGVDQAGLADSLKALIYNHREDEFIRAKKQEMLSLEAQIAEVAERKSSQKSCIAAKKLELKDLQRDIKETLKFDARTDRFGEKMAALCCEFKDFDGHSSSGTISPVESVPESVSSELED